MNVLFATSDIKMNNEIIDAFQEAGENISIHEVDYIEDISDQVWDHQTDLIILSVDAATKNIFENATKKKMFIFQRIMEWKDNFDIVLIGEFTAKDPLLNKLIEKEFYTIVPSTALSRAVSPPKSAEEALSFFEKQPGQPDLLVREKESDLFNTETLTYLPGSTRRVITHQDMNLKPMVSVFWSPLPNVGAGSFIRALGYTLASYGRKVLLIELDWEYPKLARQTALTHPDRDIKGALTRLTSGQNGLDGYLVNNEIAESELPHTHKQAKQRLRQLPSSLFALSRNAEITYEEEIDIDDDQIMEKMFFEAKQLGFQHIFVDVPSNPNHMYTMLSLLAADEKYVVVDDAFTTSGIYKIAMQAFREIDITDSDMELIITQIRDGITAQEIADFYEKTPALALPFDPEMLISQMDLKLEYGKEYTEKVVEFCKQRYALEVKNISKKKKKSVLGIL